MPWYYDASDQLCNWYYDFTNHKHVMSAEGGVVLTPVVVQLCRTHARARLAAGTIEWAARGDRSTGCAHPGCVAHNDPGRP
jgi:hypothetical protein